MYVGKLKRLSPSILLASGATLFFCTGIALFLINLSNLLPFLLMSLITLDLALLILASIVLGREWNDAYHRALSLYSIILSIGAFLIGLIRLMIFIQPLINQ